MGYTTDFEGRFNFSRPLTEQEAEYINKFSETRRMKRDVAKLYEIYKGEHGNPFLPYDKTYGNEGEYFVGGSGYAGQDHDPSVIDGNAAPGTITDRVQDWGTRLEKNRLAIAEGRCQPGLWCQWIVEDDGKYLAWDGGEKFYNYVEWLNYLISHFFSKWGVALNGEVKWFGEDRGDYGKIVITDNVVNVMEGEINYR